LVATAGREAASDYTHLDDELFAVVKQLRAGVMLVKLHLLQRISDHRIVTVDQT